MDRMPKKSFACVIVTIGIFQEWRESNSSQKWRNDGRCGKNYPLLDGTPSECNPDGENPCCYKSEYLTKSIYQCGNKYHQCLCHDCIDYRVVKEIRNSSFNNCSVVKVHGGFLRHVCFDDDKKQIFYKCLHSDVYYKAGYGTDSQLSLSYTINSVSKLCENDPHFYQACGAMNAITNSEVLCGGYLCEQKVSDGHQFIACPGGKCTPKPAENWHCDTPDMLCDDKCDDTIHCEDESNCNGYQYGVVCDRIYRKGKSKHKFSPAFLICSGGDARCADGLDEQNCTVTNSTVYTCTHYWKRITVPIHNYTRCSVFNVVLGILPYCLDYLDQTNCSDVERVGGYCEVNGYMSTVSKYMVCSDNHNAELCDDAMENNCPLKTRKTSFLKAPDQTLTTSYSSQVSTTSLPRIMNKRCPHVHKHWMCDGVMDCPDGADENPDFCITMTLELNINFTCRRRFRSSIGYSRIPLSWIMDNETDCMDGEDESSTLWDFCQENGASPSKICKTVFKCPGGTNVRLDHLCNGIETCGDRTETEVCRVARDFPSVNKVAQFNGMVRDVCQNSSSCKIKEFAGPWSTSEVFGVEKILINVPTSQISCRDLFGEHYLFLSCMGLCTGNTTCPLDNNSKLQYNSCPGQVGDRAITLADNSFLTFVVESARGNYHQEFYQCKNGFCIEYKQVCDLIDDCGDMSDEINCANHMICEETKNSTKHHFISLSQKCDGIYDCFDLSDECNESCSKQILGNWALKCTCWPVLDRERFSDRDREREREWQKVPGTGINRERE